MQFAHHTLFATLIGARIETVAAAELTALHHENFAAIPEFVAPPAHPLEQVLTTIHQLNFDGIVGN